MRYCTWRLKWIDGYGYGPEEAVNETGSLLEASSWVSPSIEDGDILGYLTGDYEVPELNDWHLTELSAEQALEFAQAINPVAYLGDDGVIMVPSQEEPAEQ